MARELRETQELPWELHSAGAYGRLRSAAVTALAPVSREIPPIAWVAGFAIIGIAAAAYPPASVPAVVLTLIGALSFPSDAPRRARLLARAATVLAALGALVGLCRFAMSKAMLGIVESGESAAAFSALWRLRDVVTAEDDVRRAAPWDPDGDHVGSASLILGLIGKEPVRGSTRLETPLLNYAFRTSVETSIGPAVKVEGYLFIVCLPTPAGGWTARPDDPVDDELAERRYIAYAWPTRAATGMNTIFFADEHERLLILDSPRGAPAPYLDTEHPPACDAALGGDGAPWKPWKNKQPRKTLPGDRDATGKG